LIVFLKEVCPTVITQITKNRILRYWDTLVPSAGQCLSIFTARTSPKKKLFYTEYFQSKIYQITRAFVRLFLEFSNVSPLGQRDFTLSVYFLHYSDWNLLRSHLLVVEDQSKQSIFKRNAIRLSSCSWLNNDVLCI